MKTFLFFLTVMIILPAAFFSCKDDKASNPKHDIYIYGLLGVRPEYSEPDSNHYWIYSRVFNHPDYQNVEAEISNGQDTLALEADHWDSDKYFTEGQADFSFVPGEEYKFKIWDTEETYSGKITTLAPLRITVDTVIAGQIQLEWTDINADFYDIELRESSSDYEKHFQVEDNQFSINLSQLPIGSASSLSIDIAGLKGFSPISDPSGNIEGCYGYFFGYSRNSTELNLSSMTFEQADLQDSNPDLDKLIWSFMKSSSAYSSAESPEDIDFTFTYGSISNYSSYPSGSNSYGGTSLVEPVGAVKTFEGQINGDELNSYSWAGFYNRLWSTDRIYDTYDRNMNYTFTLNINGLVDSAATAVPDTFSILSYPPSNPIPAAPFTISWRRPDNADFFLIDASWTVENGEAEKNFLYAVEGSSFTFSSLPANISSGRIYVTAVNGANPMKALVPNLEKLNGYFYSKRSAKSSLSYYANAAESISISKDSAENDFSVERDKRFDYFMISKLSEHYPQLKKHKSKLLKKLGSRKFD